MRRSPARTPTSSRCASIPAVHYTMGGLWVDYNLMSTIPGLFVLGEANFSDHGANRLGACALMQGLADGYFVIPYTIGNYLATPSSAKLSAEPSPQFKKREGGSQRQLHQAVARRSRASARRGRFHRELGMLMWDKCGMARNREGLQKALKRIPELREEFWKNVSVPGETGETEPGARERRPRGRLPRIRRTDVPRRAAARGMLRRAFPRGVPDRGRRGETRRRDTSPTSPPGSTRRGQATPLPAQGAARSMKKVHLAVRNYK